MNKEKGFTENELQEKNEENKDQNKESKKNSGLKSILALGRKKGMVTYKEIMDTFEHVDLSPEEIDSVYEILTSRGIEIVPETDGEDDTVDDEPVSDDDTEIEISVPEGIALDDPVRMYLKEIG